MIQPAPYFAARSKDASALPPTMISGPPAGDVVQRGELFREKDRVRPQRPEQNGRREPDPLGHGRDRREREDRLEVRVDDPVDRAEAGETSSICPFRKLEKRIAVDV